MRPALAHWSGGKDSCLALYKALRQGRRVKFLGTSLSRQTRRVAFQGLPFGLVRLQARSIGIPLRYNFLSEGDDPESLVRQAERRMRSFKARDGIGAIVSGHIGLHDGQAQQLAGTCSRLGLEMFAPLAGQDRESLLEEFLEAGFQAVLAKVDSRRLEPEWVGRPLDRRFIRHLKARGDVDLCGDRGEYHSLVLDGPLFRQRIVLDSARSAESWPWRMLDVRAYHAEAKSR